MHIWLVEDDPDFIVAAKYKIRRAVPGDHDFDVVQAPVEAVARMAAGERPDLIVCDLVFLGWATGEDVVRIAKVRGIPSLLCSDIHPAFAPQGTVRKITFLENTAQYLAGLLEAISPPSACAPLPT